MNGVQEWGRSEFASHVDKALDDAKAGAVQKIRDPEGTFEIRFVKGKKATLGDYLTSVPKDD